MSGSAFWKLEPVGRREERLASYARWEYGPTGVPWFLSEVRRSLRQSHENGLLRLVQALGSTVRRFVATLSRAVSPRFSPSPTLAIVPLEAHPREGVLRVSADCVSCTPCCQG